MVRKLVLSLIAILGAGALFVGAQNRQISGTVANPEGQPIVGATVVVDGTSAGTTTGSNGKFTLTAPADATLTVSFIGYQSQQIPVAGKTWLDIELKEDSQSIDDVIVVAYGTTKKEAFTGSASVIKTDDIAKRQVSNVTNALSGVTSGVQVTSTNGQPGTDATVRIRGIGSFSASNKPLYVVDGVPYDGQISSINTADIESLTVLKDAAASAIYGARGANGVILITTKRGKSSEAVITVDAKWGSNSRAVPQYDVITDPGQYMELVGQSMSTYAQLLRGFTPEQAAQYIEKNVYTNSAGGVGYRVFDYPEGETLIGADGKLNPNATLGYVNGDYLFLPDNWYDELFDKGNLRQEYNVSISGNSDKINYYASLGYLDDSGIMSNSGFTRYSTRLKADYQAKKWLKFGANVSYSNVENNNPTNQTSSGSSANIFYLTGMIAPIYPLYIRNAEGSVAKDSHGYTMYDFGDTSTGMPYKRTFMSGSNPASMWELDKATYTYDDFSSRYYATVDIYKGLKFTYNLGIDLSAYRYQRLYNPYYGQYSKVGGVIYVANKRELALNQQQLLNYSGTFADKHNIDILVGHETYKWKRSYLQGGREKIFNPNVVELNNAISQQSNDSYTDNYFTEGYFAQVNYDFDGKYFISGSYRRDASSRFHKDHRWGDFGSVGASWILSKENFLSGAEWLDLLKIKASYGVQGNDNLLYQTGETNYYPYADQYTLSQLDGSFATALSYKGNKDITWETSHSINAGVEFSFWQGRLAGNVEYFNRRTSDMLYYMPSPNSIGYAYYPTNVGSVRNSGVEIDLNSTVFRTKNVTWTPTSPTSRTRSSSSTSRSAASGSTVRESIARASRCTSSTCASTPASTRTVSRPGTWPTARPLRNTPRPTASPRVTSSRRSTAVSAPRWSSSASTSRSPSPTSWAARSTTTPMRRSCTPVRRRRPVPTGTRTSSGPGRSATRRVRPTCRVSTRPTPTPTACRIVSSSARTTSTSPTSHWVTRCRAAGLGKSISPSCVSTWLPTTWRSSPSGRVSTRVSPTPQRAATVTRRSVRSRAVSTLRSNS